MHFSPGSKLLQNSLRQMHIMMLWPQLFNINILFNGFQEVFSGSFWVGCTKTMYLRGNIEFPAGRNILFDQQLNT